MTAKIITLIVALIGVAGSVIPGLPGAPLIFVAALVYAWITDFAIIGARTLWILGGLAFLTQLLDFLMGSMAPRVVGATKKAALGALIGGLVGLFFMPVGLFLGPVIGAAAFELWQGRSMIQAGTAGFAAGVGFIIGTIVSIIVALIMAYMVAVNLFSS